MDVEYESVYGYGIIIQAKSDNQTIGSIELMPKHPDQLTFRCRDKLKEIPVDPDTVYAIKDVAVQEQYRGQGIGAQLYIKAAKEAISEGSIVVPGYCIEDATVATFQTDSAARVWQSRTFQNEIKVHDGMISYAVK